MKTEFRSSEVLFQETFKLVEPEMEIAEVPPKVGSE